MKQQQKQQLQQQQQQQRVKQQPVFGRPLVPFFLESPPMSPSTNGSFDPVVNESLELSKSSRDMQQTLIVPKGESGFTVREFKEGYFENRHVSLDSVLSRQDHQPTLSNGNSVSSSTSASPVAPSQTNSSSGKLRAKERDRETFDVVVKPSQPPPQSQLVFRGSNSISPAPSSSSSSSTFAAHAAKATAKPAQQLVPIQASLQNVKLVKKIKQQTAASAPAATAATTNGSGVASTPAQQQQASVQQQPKQAEMPDRIVDNVYQQQQQVVQQQLPAHPSVLPQQHPQYAVMPPHHMMPPPQAHPAWQQAGGYPMPPMQYPPQMQPHMIPPPHPIMHPPPQYPPHAPFFAHNIAQPYEEHDEDRSSSEGSMSDRHHISSSDEERDHHVGPVPTATMGLVTPAMLLSQKRSPAMHSSSYKKQRSVQELILTAEARKPPSPGAGPAARVPLTTGATAKPYTNGHAYAHDVAAAYDDFTLPPSSQPAPYSSQQVPQQQQVRKQAPPMTAPVVAPVSKPVQQNNAANSLPLTEEELLQSLSLVDAKAVEEAQRKKQAQASKAGERFAGGSWSNAPPPSSLPLPNFAKRK